MKDEKLIKKARKGFVVLFATITVILITIVGCEKNEMETSKGLGLWWNHQIFSEQGRGFIFGFTEVERSEILYELKFEYQIDNNQKIIEINLIGKIDKGKCPYFPSGGWGVDDGLCSSNGNVFIPENMLNEGKYEFTVKTSNYTVKSEMIFTKDKATLNIPENNYFSSEVKEVLITPTDLLYGGIGFKGEDLLKFAFDFIEDIRYLGLRDTIVTNPPFNLKVDETGKPQISIWQDDNYSIPFLFSMTAQFSTIFELAKVHFNKSAINIYLFSSNGDQARLNGEGANVWYAK